jgi:hypothetical protein
MTGEIGKQEKCPRYDAESKTCVSESPYVSNVPVLCNGGDYDFEEGVCETFEKRADVEIISLGLMSVCLMGA